VTEDASTGIVVIALFGSPFSARYARARRRGPSRALDHCSVNVALYHRGRSCWTLDERSVEAVSASNAARIGRSAIAWDADRLVVDVDESTKLGRRVRGRVVLRPETTTELRIALDGRGDHAWWPAVPHARIEVDMVEPGLRFTGAGYHDANAGRLPLEASFARWDWSCARAGRDVMLTYDVTDREGCHRPLALRIAPSGIAALDGCPPIQLPRTLWRLERSVRADPGHGARVLRALEDGPFYARARVATTIAGSPVVAMHETLDVRRLARGWTRLLAGFRTRRSS
jgi:carotenoid 1,2-hydratase